MIRLAENCRHGRFLYLDTDQYIGACIERFGEYSENEVEIFRQLLRPRNVVVEAGANIGTHTVPLSKIVGSEGLVWAFEPQPHIFNVLCGNLALNDCFNVRPIASGLAAEDSTMSRPMMDYSSSNNFGGVSLKTFGNGPGVPVVALDKLDIKVLHLLKADVEGMEAEVLRGGRETILRCRPYLYLEDDRVEKSEALRVLLDELGYTVHYHETLIAAQENWRNNPDNRFDGFQIASLNLLCIPKERPVEFA